MNSKLLLRLTMLWLVSAISISAQTAKTTMRAITIVTEPNAVVWLDDIKRGATDETGKLDVKFIASVGARKIRVRADGFKETTWTLLPAQKGAVKIALVKTSDEAELAFQQGEVQSQLDRTKAAEFYRKAIAARPRYPEAQLALARILSAAGDNDVALAAIAAARKARPVYPEASAVEGRIYKAEDNETKAIASFKRAITEGKGIQPEAHTGLGLLYKDKAENSAGSAEERDEYYNLAAGELKKAAAQLSGAPDAKEIYQLLGDVYYRAKKYREAIGVYEEFLRVFPDSPEATTMRSLILQTTKEMNGEQ